MLHNLTELQSPKSRLQGNAVEQMIQFLQQKKFEDKGAENWQIKDTSTNLIINLFQQMYVLRFVENAHETCTYIHILHLL